MRYARMNVKGPMVFLLALVISASGIISKGHSRTLLKPTAIESSADYRVSDKLFGPKTLPSISDFSKPLGWLNQSSMTTSAAKANGKIAFVSGRSGKGLDIYVMNEDGSGVTKLTEPVAFPNEPWRQTYHTDPAWSPDGTQIAFVSNRGYNFNIYVMNADGSNIRRLTHIAADEGSPVWSPDGRKIAFGRGYCATVTLAGVQPPPTVQCAADIYVMNADGNNQTRLTEGEDFDRDPTWSPDGAKLAFMRLPANSPNAEIYVMNADGSNLTNITNNPSYDQTPAWSPDGAKIAFASNRCCAASNSNTEIYVMNVDGSNATRLTNSQAHTMNTGPAWSPDGTKIAFERELLNSGDVWDVYVMNSDGSNLKILTPDTPQDANFDQFDLEPAWQPLPTAQSIIQFSSTDFLLSESGQAINPLTVKRTGEISHEAIVRFKTSSACFNSSDTVCATLASERSDYTTTSGTVRFAPGEVSKTIHVPIIDDAFVEGQESFRILLSNPTGGTLGGNQTAIVAITDNDTNPSSANPIDEVQFFIRQHYLDFLNREPEPEGYLAWQNILQSCPPDEPKCDRIIVSSAFFRSAEFQGSGYFVYRFYAASLGRIPHFAEFMPDMAKVSGFLSPEQLEANKAAFVSEFINRQEFRSKYDSLNDPGAYVNALVNTAGVNLPNKQQLIDDLAAGRKSRAEVLRIVAESGEVYTKYYTEAFVVMQYFGYLRRDPDILYLEWIRIMNQSSGDYRGMINGFMNSAEYRQRFGN